MDATARFISFLRAHKDNGVVIIGGLSVHQTLCTAGLLPADDADGVQLGDFLGTAHKFGHGAEWLGAEIHVESGDNDTYTPGGKVIDHRDNTHVEKLSFVKRNDSRTGGKIREDGIRLRNCLRLDVLSGVAGYVLDAEAVINVGLEDLHWLSGYSGAAHAADEFFGLTTEHAAADDFDFAYVVNHDPLLLTPPQTKADI
jgi:hypothetical protein